MANPFYGRDIVSIKDFTRADLEFLFSTTDKFSQDQTRATQLLKHKILGLMFFEPSTRTRLSFEAAIAALGGTSLGFSEPTLSAAEKGENLADTVRTMGQYADVLVLRHQKEGAAKFAAEISDRPVINGGSGSEEHPTQAMLDLYTIKKEKGGIDDLRIAVVGDLKYGRTVYSLLYALSNYSPRVYLVSPPPLRIRREALFQVGDKIEISEHENLDDLSEPLDVIYVTRIQRERFPDPQEYERVKGSYRIDLASLEKRGDDLAIMHPFPRADEIHPSIDGTRHAKYFDQIVNGKVIRAVLLGLLLTKDFA
jgi:aspartate carbamoyltransferase catalytic subunit